jgi:PadR family transcriptional regulator PadR
MIPYSSARDDVKGANYVNQLSKKTLDGNVETLILSELVKGPSYGYALVRALNETHSGLLKLGEGTIYPVLYRMEEKGLLDSEVREMPSGRQRKYYRPTKKGKAAMAENLRQWNALAKVMGKISDNVNQSEIPLGETV